MISPKSNNPTNNITNSSFDINFLKKDIIKLNLELSNDELFCENLWKEFFNTIGIKERKNLKCQMNFMPKKYWKNIIEMENNYERSNK